MAKIEVDKDIFERFKQCCIQSCMDGDTVTKFIDKIHQRASKFSFHHFGTDSQFSLPSNPVDMKFETDTIDTHG